MAAANVADAKGLTFACKPGCGFCCTASPLVLEHERSATFPMLVRADDGTHHIPLAGVACSALQADRRCGVYETRPSVCHLYPYSVHAGRRIQVTVSLACPGIEQWHPLSGPVGPFGADASAEEGAARAVELALAQPGAQQGAARAKETFAEYDRRMKEWGVAATPDRLRAGFLPHLATIAQPANLPAFFAGLETGELVLAGDAARAVGALFDEEPEADLLDLFRQGATDAFDEPETVIWVEPDLTWTRAKAEGERVKLVRAREEEIAIEDVPADWDEGAIHVLQAYLTRLAHRDHLEAASAWLVDASGYQVTPAAAFGRVVGEAALQVALRAGLLARAEARDVIDIAYARRGVMAYETAFHSLPTLGAIL
ncbi:MAG TPA: YkgJ family cysteine cluster protein [Candidatus Thermoplasmatota archaeon]|nr:YkgJ family cysteine cluster protein [Candidatus Thermoplasmatota archaeon]